MSMLLRHLSKLNILKPKDAIKKQTPPYLNLGYWLKDSSLHLYNPIKEETITISDKTLPDELVTLELVRISSHGWGLFFDEHDSSTVRMSNFFLPSSSKSSPKITSLPPLCPLPNHKLKPLKNVSMSSCPDQEDEECVVAVKFMGPQLSLCVLGRDSECTNIATPFDFFNDSSRSLTYSKKDQSLCMLAPGSRFLASWFIHSKSWDDYPKFHELRFQNIPKFEQSEWELMESCAKIEHLVVAPSGECFLIKQYGESFPFPCVSTKKELIHYKTRRFMVFRQEEEASKDGGRNMSYTEDIGDLCIFLGENEPFCVEASSCPGLKPNSIYFMGYGFGVYDLATNTTHNFGNNVLPGSSVFGCPYWIPPVYDL